MTASPPQLVARAQVDLSTLLSSHAGPFAVGFTPEGSIYAAAGESTESLCENRSGASFPRSRLSEGCAYTVIHYKGGLQWRVRVEAEPVIASFVQPTPRGFLLVGARASLLPEGPENNAVEYDLSGRVLRRFCLGDGIEDVRTSASGAIWVSYFDEGIYSDLSIGHSGCVCFHPDGRPRAGYDCDKAKTEPIDDAYAMNLVGEEDTWLYFYSQFPIVRIHGGRYHVYRCGAPGARALAVDGDRALLLGDYQRPDLVRIFRLGEKRARLEATLGGLVDEAGAPIGRARCVGVGQRLYVCRGRELLCLQDW